MFQIVFNAEFCAAHAISIGGAREPVHGHNWRVEAVIEGETLDHDGLLCDFHTAQHVLREIVEPFDNNDLNSITPFDDTNPTAEHVAKHIGESLQNQLGDALAPNARVVSVSVTEAPGCRAVYLLNQR